MIYTYIGDHGRTQYKHTYTHRHSKRFSFGVQVLRPLIGQSCYERLNIAEFTINANHLNVTNSSGCLYILYQTILSSISK